MTQEELRQFIEMQNQLKMCTDFIMSLKSSFDIPIEIDAAFNDRFIAPLPLLKASTVAATAHNKSVNEAGSATYAVMDKPTGFVEVTINDTIRVIPYF